MQSKRSAKQAQRSAFWNSLHSLSRGTALVLGCLLSYTADCTSPPPPLGADCSRWETQGCRHGKVRHRWTTPLGTVLPCGQQHVQRHVGKVLAPQAPDASAAGLFEWSMRYQDGTGPTSRPRELTEADQLWCVLVASRDARPSPRLRTSEAHRASPGACRLTEALKSAMVDFGDRLQDITAELAGGPEIGADVLAEKEQLLDELMEIVENIDQARGAPRRCRTAQPLPRAA